MKRLYFLLITCCFCVISSAQGNQDDFQAFRKKMLSDYGGFRKNILDDYAKFLNGIWEDYEVFTGRKSHPEPKPDVQPKKKEDEPKPEPTTVVPEEVKPAEPVIADEPQPVKPTVIPPTTDMVSFNWCGMTMQLPDAKLKENLNELSKQSLVSYLEHVNNSRLADEVTNQLVNIANSCNFNDWCLYLFIDSYVKKIKSNSNANTRNFLSWYMMANLGYDARLAFNGNNLFILMPSRQTIYARTYINIENKQYYIWGDGKMDDNEGISTPSIPEESGKPLNIIMSKPLVIPYKAKKFSHTFKGRTLSGEVNENLIQVMKKFPQIPIPIYAVSEGDAKARKQILSQMKGFIKDMSELEAANFILQFIQSYEYATDDQQFGYEKPFFIEELLFYPKCDCEDRAIFYYYLVTNLLGNDVHLVHYPNHECNAVNFSQNLNADSYSYNGKQYVICDPTYIGATIGMCMPDFRKVKPEIDLIK